MFETERPTRLDIGRVLNRSAKVFADHALLFLGIVTLFYLPILGLGLASELFLADDIIALENTEAFSNTFTGIFARFAGSIALMAALSQLLLLIAQAAIIQGVFKSLKGEPTSFGSSIEVIFSNLLPIVGTALLVWMIKIVGFMMCLIPGFIAALMFYVAMPVVVVEGKSMARAIQRSDWLTGGFRGEIFVLLVILWIVSAIGNKVLGMAVGIAAFGNLAIITSTLLTSALTIAVTAFEAVLVSVTYYELRLIKDEDIDAGELLAVFD